MRPTRNPGELRPSHRPRGLAAADVAYIGLCGPVAIGAPHPITGLCVAFVPRNDTQLGTLLQVCRRVGPRNRELPFLIRSAIARGPPITEVRPRQLVGYEGAMVASDRWIPGVRVPDGALVDLFLTSVQVAPQPFSRSVFMVDVRVRE